MAKKKKLRRRSSVNGHAKKSGSDDEPRSGDWPDSFLDEFEESMAVVSAAQELLEPGTELYEAEDEELRSEPEVDSSEELSEEERAELKKNLDESGSEVDDPIRQYFIQMGAIPLLDRAEEIAAAKEIEATELRLRMRQLSTVFVIERLVTVLERLRDKQLRIDRTVEVSVTDKVLKNKTSDPSGVDFNSKANSTRESIAEFAGASSTVSQALPTPES